MTGLLYPYYVLCFFVAGSQQAIFNNDNIEVDSTLASVGAGYEISDVFYPLLDFVSCQLACLFSYLVIVLW